MIVLVLTLGDMSIDVLVAWVLGILLYSVVPLKISKTRLQRFIDYCVAFFSRGVLPGISLKTFCPGL